MRNLGLGLAAGTCAGSIVGVAEALALLQSRSPAEYQAFGYAYTLYGLVGGLVGLGVGLLLAPLGARVRAPAAWTFAFVCALGSMGLVLVHHLLDQQLYEGDGVPVAVVGGGVAATVVLGALGWTVGTNLLTKTPLFALTTPKGAVAAWGGGLVLAWVFALSPAPPPPDVAPAGPPAPAAPGLPDLVVVVIEGWRGDARGTALVPQIEAFAREAVDFRQHVVSAPSTRASMASLATSMAVSSHGVASGRDHLSVKVQTLAEVLSGRGYRTVGVPNDGDISASLGFAQGFQRYDYAPALPFAAAESTSALTLYRLGRELSAPARLGPDGPIFTDARRVLAFGADVLTESPEPAFVMLHLLEATAPWRPVLPRSGAPDPRPVADVHAAVVDEYRRQLALIDAELGAFFQRLRAAGRYEGATIVVTSDHGIELGDHGAWSSGECLYDEQVRVPLLVKLPGGRHAGTQVTWQVRQVDVAPTLADLAGARAPEAWQGTELFPDSFAADLALAQPGPTEIGGVDVYPLPPSWGRHPASRDALIEAHSGGYRLAALRSRGLKTILALRTPRGDPRRQAPPQLFDLSTDPTEQTNLADAGSSTAAGLRAALEAVLEDRARKAVDRRGGDLDEAERCRLCELGYLPAADCIGCLP